MIFLKHWLKNTANTGEVLVIIDRLIDYEKDQLGNSKIKISAGWQTVPQWRFPRATRDQCTVVTRDPQLGPQVTFGDDVHWDNDVHRYNDDHRDNDVQRDNDVYRDNDAHRDNDNRMYVHRDNDNGIVGLWTMMSILGNVTTCLR